MLNQAYAANSHKAW